MVKLITMSIEIKKSELNTLVQEEVLRQEKKPGTRPGRLTTGES